MFVQVMAPNMLHLQQFLQTLSVMLVSQSVKDLHLIEVLGGCDRNGAQKAYMSATDGTPIDYALRKIELKKTPERYVKNGGRKGLAHGAELTSGDASESRLYRLGLGEVGSSLVDDGAAVAMASMPRHCRPSDKTCIVSLAKILRDREAEADWKRRVDHG